LKRPAFTTQKTVVLNPMPTPSVRIAPSERVGYRNSIRTPDVRSRNSRSMARSTRRVHYLHLVAGVSAVTFFVGFSHPLRSGLVHPQVSIVAP
jgi:hypothetical protein